MSLPPLEGYDRTTALDVSGVDRTDRVRGRVVNDRRRAMRAQLDGQRFPQAGTSVSSLRRRSAGGSDHQPATGFSAGPVLRPGMLQRRVRVRCGHNWIARSRRRAAAACERPELRHCGADGARRMALQACVSKRSPRAPGDDGAIWTRGRTGCGAGRTDASATYPHAKMLIRRGA